MPAASFTYASQAHQPIHQQHGGKLFKDDDQASSHDDVTPPLLGSVEAIVREGLRRVGGDRLALVRDVRQQTYAAYMTFNLHTHHRVAAGARDYADKVKVDPTADKVS